MVKKIICWALIGIIIVISGLFIILAYVKINPLPQYSDPEMYWVYKNGTKKFYDQIGPDANYDRIFNEVKNSAKQNAVSAMFNGTLFDKFEFKQNEETSIDLQTGNYVLGYYSEKQNAFINKTDKAINFTYNCMLIELNYDNSKIEQITLYLGKYDGTTFNYGATYSYYGSLRNLTVFCNELHLN